jgi:hypothetical protein
VQADQFPLQSLNTGTGLLFTKIEVYLSSPP